MSSISIQLPNGRSRDYGDTDFHNNTELGQLTPDRTVTETGIFVGGDEFNTRIDAENRYYGIYLTDTFSVTDKLDVTLSGRYNHAEVEITDKLGTDLNGDHTYNRFNPAVGATYAVNKRAHGFRQLQRGQPRANGGGVELRRSRRALPLSQRLRRPSAARPGGVAHDRGRRAAAFPSPRAKGGSTGRWRRSLPSMPTT